MYTQSVRIVRHRKFCIFFRVCIRHIYAIYTYMYVAVRYQLMLDYDECIVLATLLLLPFFPFSQSVVSIRHVTKS